MNNEAYYCENCNLIFNEPKEYTENREPYGGGSGDSSFIEHYLGCPSCSGGYTKVYLCENCGKHKERVDFYPFANAYMCDECHDNLLELGELVENEMEEVIKNEEQRGLCYEEE